MRGNDDFRPTAQVKRDNARYILSSYCPTDTFAFDDNEAALKTYRAAGLNVLCAPQCWDELLVAMRYRAKDETAASVLKRYVAQSTEDFVEIATVHQKDSRSAVIQPNDGDRGGLDLDSKSKVNRETHAMSENNPNHIGVRDDRD